MGKSKKKEQPATDPSGRNSDSGNPDRPSQPESTQEGEFRNAGIRAGLEEEADDSFDSRQEDIMVETGNCEKVN